MRKHLIVAVIVCISMISAISTNSNKEDSSDLILM